MSGSGAVLLLMENVVFRKVLPEQIQMAIAAQSATEDALASVADSVKNVCLSCCMCEACGERFGWTHRAQDQKIYEIEWQEVEEEEEVPDAEERWLVLHHRASQSG